MSELASGKAACVATLPALRELDRYLALFMAGKPERTRANPEATMRHNLPCVARDIIFRHWKIAVPDRGFVDKPQAVMLHAGAGGLYDDVWVEAEVRLLASREAPLCSSAGCVRFVPNVLTTTMLPHAGERAWQNDVVLPGSVHFRVRYR